MEQSIDTILIVLFLTALAIPVYSYFVFPMILRTIVRFKEIDYQQNESYEPSVTLIISAYNEEAVIAAKLENSKNLDYPSEKLQIIVINDGSTDRTDEIIESYKASGILHHRVEGRQGKNEAINKTWPLIEGEIVVFSDANSIYRKDAIRQLVSHYADQRIGCVCGELTYIDVEAGTASGEGLYWEYEQFLKRLQSRIGDILVLNGSIFALRHELFQQLHPKIANDFQVPINIAEQNYAIVYEPKAIAVEKAAGSAKDELGRKARIIARGYEGFFHYLPKLRGIRLFQFISMKFLRWNVWLAMLAMIISNTLLLDYRLFQYAFIAQLLFYSLAVVGPVLNRLKIPGIILPYYFCMINLGAIIGLWRFVTRKQKASWEPPNSAR